MINYNPFSKDLSDIDENELLKLIENSISEGWYIEFKSDFSKKGEKIDNTKIAKSISAFANTKGGWLFYGIESNDKNIATNLCGIDLNQYKNLADQLSQIIAESIFPKPIYHFKTVELSSNKTVLIIQIEESPTPPYITSQGIIYQRENNQSNPIKDRYILERLTQKTEDYHSSIERFSKIDYQETKGQSESNQSYLEMYLFPIPYNGFEFKNFYTSDFFKNVADRFYQGGTFYVDEKPISLGLKFNSVYSSQSSIIIRPLNKENLIYKTTIAELLINGGLKFLIPISEFSLKDIPKRYEDSSVIKYLQENYHPYENLPFDLDDSIWAPPIHNDPNNRREETEFVNYIKMIDGESLMLATLLIGHIYEQILLDNNYNFKDSIGFRAKLTSTWRKFIFFDDDDYLEKIKLYNLPIAPKDKIEIPRFIKGNHYEMVHDEEFLYYQIPRIILEAFGLPNPSDINLSKILDKALKRFE